MRKLSGLKDSKGYQKRVSTKNHFPVLVLGAGYSGLSGAVEFLRNGFEDFLVLEGDSAIGGRVKNFDLNGTAIELGANWLSDISPVNPIWNIAREVKLGGDFVGVNETGESKYYFQSQNRYLTREEEDEIETRVDFYQEKLCLLAQQRWSDQLPDISIEKALKMIGWQSHPSLDSIDATLFSVIALEPNGISDFDHLSLYTYTSNFLAPFIDIHNPKTKHLEKQYDDVMERTNPEFYVADPRGFSYLIKRLFESPVEAARMQSKLRLNSRVTSIDYSTEPIVVTTASGEVYSCDYALCTFSVGVLKSNNVKFVPSLCAEKKAALDLIQMGGYVKLFLQFDSDFWSDRFESGFK